MVRHAGQIMQMSVRMTGPVTAMTKAEAANHRRSRERLNRKAQCQDYNEDKFAPAGHGSGI